MRVFVSYKYSGLDKDMVKNNMKKLKKSFDNINIETYIHCLDDVDSQDSDIVYAGLRSQIFDSNYGLIYIDSEVPSAGMYLEISLMKDNDIPFVVFIDKNIKNSHFFADLAENVIEIEDYDDFIKKSTKFFGIDQMRDYIDEIDNNILLLLKERFECVNIVGKYKNSEDMTVLQQNRWNELLNQKIEIAKQYDISPELVEKIWNDIHEYSLKHQNDLKNGK